MQTIKLNCGSWTLDRASPIGKPGGFGGVYVGTSAEGAPVAIKVLNVDPTGAGKRELKFAEAFVGRKLEHVIPILDFGIDAQLHRACIVMERASGNLREHINRGLSCEEREVLEILRQVTMGLLEAKGWIHRDLKPENILTHRGRWQIADFGIARVAGADTSLNTLKESLTPAYAAPEQWDGRRASPATDVYALGCIGCELLLGHHLFPGADEESYADQHRHSQPKFDGGSPLLRSLLFRMVAKSDKARPALDRVLAELSTALNKTVSKRAESPLALANLAVEEERSRKQSLEALALADTAQRERLSADAIAELRRTAEALFTRVKDEAPAADCRVVKSPPYMAFEAALGQGVLRMTVGRYTHIPSFFFRSCGWDVLCGDEIQVGRNGYSRSASLWYVNEGNGDFRWVEVAYWNHRGNSSHEPSCLEPGLDAGHAASSGMHTWRLAYQPKAIGGSHLEQFVERWIGFLARAAMGQLQHPLSLPEG